MTTEHKPQERCCPSVTWKPNCDKNQKHLAACWMGVEKVRVCEKPTPTVTDPGDAIVRITTSAIGGSDLHLYFNKMPGSGMFEGDVLGHEAVGIVESVGSSCQKINAGDRVVVSAIISCGNCNFCKAGQMSLCERTNPSDRQTELYGDKMAGTFGYSKLVGHYDGCQAEYVRVPLADVNLLKIPDSLSDEKAIVLSDVLCAAWQGNEFGEVGPETIVAIWGAGPVGLLTAYLAKHRGAKQVIIIDKNQYRLDFALSHGATEAINFETTPDVVCQLRKLTGGVGPDTSIDCAGFRFPKKLIEHKIQRAVFVETDTSEIVCEMIKATRKGGTLVLVGEYFGVCDNFCIGAMMKKGLTVRGAPAYVQRYWPLLLSKLEKGELDPMFIISHKFKLEDAEHGYEMFGKQQGGVLKPLLLTRFGSQRLHRTPS